MGAPFTFFTLWNGGGGGEQVCYEVKRSFFVFQITQEEENQSTRSRRVHRRKSLHGTIIYEVLEICCDELHHCRHLGRVGKWAMMFTTTGVDDNNDPVKTSFGTDPVTSLDRGEHRRGSWRRTAPSHPVPEWRSPRAVRGKPYAAPIPPHGRRRHPSDIRTLWNLWR